jgi:hypothetical protein
MNESKEGIVKDSWVALRRRWRADPQHKKGTG